MGRFSLAPDLGGKGVHVVQERRSLAGHPRPATATGDDDAHADADGYAHPDEHAHRDADANEYADAWPHRHVHPEADGDQGGDPDGHVRPAVHGDRDAWGYGYPNHDGDTQPHGDGQPFARTAGVAGGLAVGGKEVRRKE
jgi:hypothetical protein